MQPLFVYSFSSGIFFFYTYECKTAYAAAVEVKKEEKTLHAVRVIPVDGYTECNKCTVCEEKMHHNYTAEVFDKQIFREKKSFAGDTRQNRRPLLLIEKKNNTKNNFIARSAPTE